MGRISVIICTHNPRPDYLRRTLDALQAQTLSKESWEFLLIDNASSETLSNKWDLSWHPRGRHVREDEPGLTVARLRGIKESSGELLVFVDDDNVLAPDFLERAAAIKAKHPNLSAFGPGMLGPEFEVPPPPELLRRVYILAIRKIPAAQWGNNPRDASYMPCGAGLCVTRETADGFRELIHKLNVTSVLGRRGRHLFSGEDDLFSWAAAWAGRDFGVFPELRITHLIDAKRLNHDYFVRLIYAHTYSHCVLDYLLAGAPHSRIGPIRCVRVLLHGIKNGWFSMRYQWAMARGEHNASQFISECALRPMENSSKRLAGTPGNLKTTEMKSGLSVS